MWFKTKKNKSYIRHKWAIEQARINKRIGPGALYLSWHKMFQEIVIAISYFAEHRHKSDNNALEHIHKSVSMQLQGDSSLFEISCFVYYKIFAWLSENTPENLKSDVFIDSLAKDFIDLFKRALSNRDIKDLFFSRIQGYTEVGDAGKCHYYLIELLKRSTNNSLPAEYKFGEEPLLIVSIFEEMTLKMYVGAFESGMLPVITASVEKYLEQFK